MGERNTLTRDPWTAYWQSGAGSSCFENPEINVHFTRLWHEHVDAMDDGERMLDLATGNGAVARVCAERAASHGWSFEVVAIDSAEINPAPHSQGQPEQPQRISFRGNTRIESLPFRDRSFDSVVSQFGFEYACEARAAAEAARVLAPGGRIRFLIHSKAGAVARDIRWRLDRMHSVLSENAPVSLALELARALEAGDRKALEAKSRHLPRAIEHVNALRQDPPPDDSALFFASEFLQLWGERMKYRPRDLRASIEDGWANINFMAIRQEEMLSAARGKQGMEKLRNRFESLGLTVEAIDKVNDSSQAQIAWLLDARKPI